MDWSPQDFDLSCPWREKSFCALYNSALWKVENRDLRVFPPLRTPGDPTSRDVSSETGTSAGTQVTPDVRPPEGPAGGTPVLGARSRTNAMKDGSDNAVG